MTTAHLMRICVFFHFFFSVLYLTILAELRKCWQFHNTLQGEGAGFQWDWRSARPKVHETEIALVHQRKSRKQIDVGQNVSLGLRDRRSTAPKWINLRESYPFWFLSYYSTWPRVFLNLRSEYIPLFKKYCVLLRWLQWYYFDPDIPRAS